MTIIKLPTTVYLVLDGVITRLYVVRVITPDHRRHDFLSEEEAQAFMEGLS